MGRLINPNEPGSPPHSGYPQIPENSTTYVRDQRGLRLQPGQVPDRLPRRQLGPSKQQLAVERGAVKRPQAERGVAGLS